MTHHAHCPAGKAKAPKCSAPWGCASCVRAPRVVGLTATKYLGTGRAWASQYERLPGCPRPVECEIIAAPNRPFGTFNEEDKYERLPGDRRHRNEHNLLRRLPLTRSGKRALRFGTFGSPRSSSRIFTSATVASSSTAPGSNCPSGTSSVAGLSATDRSRPARSAGHSDERILRNVRK